MRAYRVILVLSLVTLAAGSIPPRKQFLLKENNDWDLSENPLKSLNSLKTTNLPKLLVDPSDGVEYRLPNDTYPIHYDISLKTDIHVGDFAFSGTVEILLQARQPTNEITLHYRELTILKVELYDQAGIIIRTITDYTFNEDVEFLIIPTVELLALDTQYKLKIQYQGTLRNDNAGFYRSSYVNADEEIVWLATTQFESTDARHGFPCYDETGIRATYTISIEHHNSYNAISNMPQVSRLPVLSTPNVITKFQKSLKVQTYLVAFVVSDFHMIEDKTSIPPQRVFATPQQVADGDADFALDFGVKVIEKYEQYLGVKYIMPKLDQISMPDFAAGAMENWGLVTYRETALLFSNKTSNNDDKFWVASVIAHEYGHQWFGDHVAPTWWQFLWLNEGFATLFESYATGLVYPEWRSMETFVTGVVHYVFQSDSLDPRPMSLYVESPEAIDNLFDDVPYEKAASVLRMLQTIMTDETFARGLKSYLEEKQEANANPTDLYRHFQAAIDSDLLVQTPDIAGFMSTWEMQAGFPVVNVIRNDNVLMISQERYFRDRTDDPTNSVWRIPLNYVVGANPDFTKTTLDFWLTEKSMNFDNASARKKWTENDWILFNIQETGYYRVNYDLALWKLLSDELTKGNFSKIQVVNRAQLIDDSFNLARSQRLAYSVPLDVLSYIKLEDDYIAWAAANRALNFLRPALIGSQSFSRFQKFMRDNVDLLYTKFGATSKTTDLFLDKFSRNFAISWACSMGHEKCLSDTTNQMVQVANGQLNIEPDLEFAVYCAGLREATKTTFDAIWIKALASKNSPSKSDIMNALGCSQNSEILKNYLETTINSGASQSDQIVVFQALLSYGQLTGLNVVIDLVEKTSSNVQKTIVGNIATRLVNAEQATKLQNILKTLQDQNVLKSEDVSAVTKAANDRLAWVNGNVPAIETWLSENVTDGASTVYFSVFIVLAVVFVQLFV